MSRAIIDGGPAFPVPSPDFDLFTPNNVAEMERLASGMSLRDYFAAKAMQSIISRMDSAQYNYTGAEAVASDAYAFADAMITARGW